jgi:DNA-binding response OmpR family regulator
MPMNEKKSKKQNARILVLEPDEPQAAAIVTALHESAPDALVEMAYSLEDAQRLVLGVKPDLFVLDVDAMPDLGQDFLYDLRTSHPNARAIILTGVHLSQHREEVVNLGAIHFLEKPLPQAAFVQLAQALLQPEDKAEKFQGTLRDLHFTDIIQLKCMSGATSVVEFAGPNDQKARVFFENGQVRHAVAPGRAGMEAFNEIVSWKGGTISEVAEAEASPKTIDLDWQMLLLDATRKSDEKSSERMQAAGAPSKKKPKILVTDDSLMLLNFVKEILLEANYDVITAANGEESLRAAQNEIPDLILLDYVLPDVKGNEVCRRLLENPGTADIPVVYMSGFTADVQSESGANPNVIGFLNKPFTSDLLIETVQTHMPKSPDEPEPFQTPEESRYAEASFPVEQEPAYRETSQVGTEAAQTSETPWWAPAAPDPSAASFAPPAPSPSPAADPSLTAGLYFCGDTRFFSINRALQTIGKEKLTGTFRAFWDKEPIDLLVQNGQIVLATSRDPDLYCPEAPVTLANVDPERIAAAKNEQRAMGQPLFLTLADENLIVREPAMQLVQHHGQKLFAQLWTTPTVRFLFEQQGSLPHFANQVAPEPEIDHWALASLRFVQFPQLSERAANNPASIPAYTRDGFQRIQNLRLTVAEAQFASQFNGMRSIAQIAKNLRLDLKFARLTLFRFLALEIVECWPPATGGASEQKGVFQRLKNTIGLGD